MSSPLATPRCKLRPLAPRDLEAVVAIDASLRGRTRRAYFERRLAAAQRDPQRHLQVAVEADGPLAGYILGRALEGEFGLSEPAARLESFGVVGAGQGQGRGAALMEAFEDAARKLGLGQVRTTALWRERALLGFLDRSGFRLAQVHVLERDTSDFAPLARDEVDVRTLQDADIEGLARLDRRITGRERRGYLCRNLRDTLADSALRVSLAAHVDRGVAAYLMARIDYGDFGRVEPAAVIDTIGVDPLRARQGIGRALLSQLFANLGALGVERVETEVAPGNLDLLGFFYAAGFTPSERLSFLKPLP